MTYFVFSWLYDCISEVYSAGGWNDFRGARDTLEGARELAATAPEASDYQIVEVDGQFLVEEGCIANGLCYTDEQADAG